MKLPSLNVEIKIKKQECTKVVEFMTVCYSVIFCIHFRDEQNQELKMFLIQGNIVAVVMIDVH